MPLRETTVSRFFEPKQKRRKQVVEVEVEGISENANREVSPGSATNPVVLEDDLEDSNLLQHEENYESLSLERLNPSPEGACKPSEGQNKNATNDVTDDAPPTDNQNPFARFAHNSTSPNSSRPKSDLAKWKSSSQVLSQPKGAKKAKVVGDKKQESFTSVRDLPEEEKRRIITKWHSMADASAPMEVRRFQVLVAARLHARCQEPSVRKAMKSLSDNLADFTVEVVAAVDPEILALCITNLQFYNAKAKQIVKAANEIVSRFNGEVPEDVNSLLTITGVGKVFADLLAFVNSRKAHNEHVVDDAPT